MSTTTAFQVPAGWYADPVGSSTSAESMRRRWWDGVKWTAHTDTAQTPASPVVTTEAFAAAAAFAATVSAAGTLPATASPRESARIAETMPLHIVDPAAALRSASSPVSVSTASEVRYETFDARENTTPCTSSFDAGPKKHNPVTLRVHTISIWLVATMPITQSLLVFWVFTTLPAESSGWTRALAVILPFVLCGALAGQDTRLMALSGHLRTAPWLTALLAPPIYLAVRGRRVTQLTGATPWPLLVWATAQLAVIAAWYTLDPGAVTVLLATLA